MAKRPRFPAYLFLTLMMSLLMLPFAGCTQKQSEERLQGAGATFPNPLYQKWFSEYNTANPDTKFDYQSIGSGGGIKQISSKTVDFAGSDAPMNDDQIKAAPAELLHIPTVMGADVVTYNVPGLETTTLKLSGDTVADVFLGKIKKWSDPALAKDNPNVKFPDSDISVVHRSDGSGTTYIFTDYLSKISSEWQTKVGKGTSPNWPVGIGAKGNEGVTGQVKQTPNSIGYVELIYAIQNKLPYADLKDADGEFVHPSLETVSNAAAGAAANMPPDLRVSITNAPGKDAYPISSFTYFLVYKDQLDQAKGEALVKFLWWAVHDGEKMAPDLVYAPLPAQVVQKDEEKIKAIMCNGKPLYTS
ncbi:MAG TPA: phosphate ABC transporter substrate-binding protein PstS [Blastocatellia bacterium]|nr:phosphate ABC transporter substrate-binding protein PstS [Blastocatellia bacterium]